MEKQTAGTWSHGNFPLLLQDGLPIKGDSRQHPLFKHDNVASIQVEVVVLYKKLFRWPQCELTCHDVPGQEWGLGNEKEQHKRNTKLQTEHKRKESQECEMRDTAASCSEQLHIRALLQNSSCSKVARGPYDHIRAWSYPGLAPDRTEEPCPKCEQHLDIWMSWKTRHREENSLIHSRSKLLLNRSIETLTSSLCQHLSMPRQTSSISIYWLHGLVLL